MTSTAGPGPVTSTAGPGAVRGRRLAAAAALAAAALMTPVAALAYAAGAGARHPGAASPPCLSSDTVTWLGLGHGRATVSTMLYPIEVSNSSPRSCTLNGFPAAWTVSGTGIQVGLPAVTGGTPHLVVLAAGRTAHATLEITPGRDVPGCKLRPASYLQVRLPGETTATTIPALTVTACANATVLRIGPVQAGVGVPGRAGSLGAARRLAG